MKITINIPELKITREVLKVELEKNKLIFYEGLNSSEKETYDNFMKITANSDVFEIQNSPIELYIHRACNHTVCENKYIDYNDLTDSQKVLVDDFINLVKNK